MLPSSHVSSIRSKKLESSQIAYVDGERIGATGQLEYRVKIISDNEHKWISAALLPYPCDALGRYLEKNLKKSEVKNSTLDNSIAFDDGPTNCEPSAQLQHETSLSIDSHNITKNTKEFNLIAELEIGAVRCCLIQDKSEYILISSEKAQQQYKQFYNADSRMARYEDWFNSISR